MEKIFTTENFENEVLKAELPVLVDFYADWCGPCKMMAPVVAKMAEQYAGRIIVGKCNIDENMDIAQKYRVASIPTFIGFKDGLDVLTAVGGMSEKDLIAKIEQILA